jgi:ADP-ribosyl-[dinitrogen reductase] hydrolase
MDAEDRAIGCLQGLACGDALGRPVEFKTPGQIENLHGEVTEMLGNGTHGKPAGTITDDTQLALRIARSLEDNGGFRPEDIANRFVEWYESGPFDIGTTTRDSIQSLQGGVSWKRAGEQVWDHSPEGSNAGNGSVMRCAPYAIAFTDRSQQLRRISQDSSRITHADPRCTHGCAVLNLTIANCLRGEDSPLEEALDSASKDAPDELVDPLRDLPQSVNPIHLRNTGYVVHTLQTALYDALRADSFEEAVIAAVNRGGDADTNGAVTGAVTGARFGAGEIPDRWINRIDEASELERLAKSLR